MHKYFLRITFLECTKEEAVELIQSLSQKYIYCFEGGPDTGQQPHLHCYMETINPIKNRYKIQKVVLPPPERRVVKKGKKFNGNPYYCLQVPTGEEVDGYNVRIVSYILKQGDYVYKNIPVDILGKALERDEQFREIKKKKKKLPVWKQIMDTITVPTNIPVIYPLREKRKFVMEKVLDYHLQNELLVRQFQVQSYTDTICLKLFPNTKYDMIEKWL